MSVALGAVGYLLSENFVELLGTPTSIKDQARDYLQVTFLGILFLFG